MTIIPDSRWGDLLDIRATQPEAIGAALAARTPRAMLSSDGATFIIAIDHPATSLPGPILGGAPGSDPESAFDEWRRAMAVPNVRGLGGRCARGFQPFRCRGCTR